MTVRQSNSRSNGDVLLDRLDCFDDTLIVYVTGVITLFVDHEAVDEARVQRTVPIERLAIAWAQASTAALRTQ
jgi:hypothetical protein